MNSIYYSLINDFLTVRAVNCKPLFLLIVTLIGAEIIAMSFRQHLVSRFSRYYRPTIWKAFRCQEFNSFRFYSNTASVDGVDASANSGNKKTKKKSKADTVAGDNRNSTESLEDFRQSRLKKINTIRERGGNPFAYTFDQTHKVVTLIQKVR